MTSDPKDNSEDLPGAHEQAELMRFAGRLRDNRPQLSSEALMRIERKVQAELNRTAAPRHSTPLRASLLAAGIMLALTLFLFADAPRNPARVAVVADHPEAQKALAAPQRSAREVLSCFAGAKTVQQKLAVLPELTAVCKEADLPEEARYLWGLEILRPHLTWHAAYLPPPANLQYERALISQQEETNQAQDYDYRWEASHAGEAWMLTPQIERDIKAQQDAQLAERARLKSGGIDQKKSQRERYFWRLDNPRHPDVARAKALLQSVHTDEGQLASRAGHWLEEIDRNNTVITFDVPGGFYHDQTGYVVMDVRAADQVSFKLYRVTDAKDLLATASRIGEDFIFRDHAISGLTSAKLDEICDIKELAKFQRNAWSRQISALPALSDLAAQWSCKVSALKNVNERRSRWPHEWYDDDWDDADDPEAGYFGDRCEQHRARLNNEYHPKSGEASAWQCGRIVEIPAKALAQPGAYVLVGEANGQRAYAPILVDPLRLTLRRCRDGVFTLVSDSDGKNPVPAAEVTGTGALASARTDAQGAAFVRIFAAGDRAILAHKDGRWALGGFGQVFDGVYANIDDFQYASRCWSRELLDIQGKVMHVEDAAQVYEDQYVVAAYTDRPAYRPGQEVNFKLIARRFEPRRQTAEKASEEFRASDFEFNTNLSLLPAGSTVIYTVLDAKGRGIASGSCTLNDFGTAAGKLTLSAEAATGAYSLRVNLGNQARVVPHVFAVKYYRRPNFEVAVSGLPAKIEANTELKLHLAGRYYFGQAVTQGRAALELVSAAKRQPLAEAAGALEAAGGAALTLKIPAQIPAGKYFIIASLTDESGRTVSQSYPAEAPGKNLAATAALGALPRFAEVNSVLRIPASAVITALAEGQNTQLRFEPVKGMAEIKLPWAGWYQVRADGEPAEIYAYDNHDEPRIDQLKQAEDKQAVKRQMPRWVNLTCYDPNNEATSGEDTPEVRYAGQYGGRESVLNREQDHVWALFDRCHVAIGQKLRVLVFTKRTAARVVFTIEGRTVVDYSVAQLKGHYQVVEIPVKERYLPNFYLQARVVSGNDEQLYELEAAQYEIAKQELKEAGPENPRGCRVDVIDPNPAHAGEKLLVTLEPGAQEFKPGETVGVNLKVTDLAGRPQEAEISLSAADESVFIFGSENLSSVTQTFAASRAERSYMRKAWRNSANAHWGPLQTQMKLAQNALQEQQRMMEQACKASERLAELQSALPGCLDRPAPLHTLGGLLPVTNFPLGQLRTDFRETAAWQPQLCTGPDGLGFTSFTLPDSLTSYRLSALALTKQTELGTAHAIVRAALPLAVQCFLPRFAVEEDRLLAVGLVHNNSDKPVTCPVSFAVSGASPDGFEDAAGDWTVSSAAGVTVAQRQVTVSAHGSMRSGLWLKMNQAGTARVVFSGGTAQASDAEERLLPVQPLGRETTAAFNGSCEKERTLALPPKFVAGGLRLSLAVNDLPQVVDSLASLVEYPYGCVEQTMSRFLPAVMVRRATQNAPVKLPAEIEKKLPDVIEKGLARLCNFQHDDGGWGWWEKDATHDAMTVYVVCGLGLCKRAGVRVNEQVLNSACAFLKGRLSDGSLKQAGCDSLSGGDLESSAWLALAIAGGADREQLAAAAERALKDGEGEACCNLALACRAQGLNEAAGKVWARARGWKAATTAQLALKLNGQLAFGMPGAERDALASALLAKRMGNQWENTRATAWAIDSLSGLLATAPARTPIKSLRVSLDGKPLLDIRDPQALNRAVHSLVLNAAQLPSVPVSALKIEADSALPVNYALNISGTQRMDKLPALTGSVRMLRRCTTLDGKPLTGPLKAGELAAVHVTLENSAPASFVLVEDRRPSNCEFAGEDLLGGAAKSAAHAEFRDDRICVFFTSLPAGKHELAYYLRAETKGTAHILPGRACPMYNESDRSETESAKIEVR